MYFVLKVNKYLNICSADEKVKAVYDFVASVLKVISGHLCAGQSGRVTIICPLHMSVSL